MGRNPLQLEHEVKPRGRLKNRWQASRTDLLFVLVTKKKDAGDLDGTMTAIRYRDRKEQTAVQPTVVWDHHESRIALTWV